MMEAAGVLQTHYSKATRITQGEMIKAKLKGQKAEAKKYKKLLDKMIAEYSDAVDLIGNEITSPEELKNTRVALRSAADDAHDLVKKLEKANRKLADIVEAAKFMSGIVKQLTKIL